jgi:hypothetical protein
MMIKKIFLLFLVTAGFVFAQNFPKNFLMGKELTTASTTYDENPAGNNINDILIVGDTVWLGTSRGLSRSTDNGATWKNYYGTQSFGTESITALAYYNGIIFISTAHSVTEDGQDLPAGSGIRFSKDNGETWTSVSQPVDDPNDTIVVYGINKIRALPVTVAVQNIIYDIAAANDKIWIAAFAGGLRNINIDTLVANPKAKWQRVVIPPDNLNSIKPTDTLHFTLQPVAGAFGPDNNLNHRLFSVITPDDSTVYIGTANGVNKTTNSYLGNSQQSWTKYNHQNNLFNPISGDFIVALCYNQNTNTVWAASWVAEDPNEFYAVSSSSDGGNDWMTSLRDEKVHNFGTIGYTNVIVAASDNGPYLSPIYNGYASRWVLPGPIVDNTTKITLATNQFYAASFLKSESIWLGSAEGLVRNSTIAGFSSWSNDWRIFLASQPLSQQNQSYAFPNPFSPRLEQVKIKYSTGGVSANVTIRIFNFGMNYVRTIIQNAPRGNSIHVVDQSTSVANGVIDFWDGKDDSGRIVPNGVYFYRIEVGSNTPIYGKIMVIQ